jgi:uncharacterized BrkB/YihY/UPF0761 family membrane protein
MLNLSIPIFLFWFYYYYYFTVFGGMDLSSMMSNINPEMLKDLTPEKIQDALRNLPPHMKDMMQSMGELQNSS